MAVIKKIRKNGVNNPIGADASNVSYSGDVAGATNVKDALDALAAGGGSTPDMSQYGYYGENYPEQMAVVRNVLSKNKYGGSNPRLRFIHISDSHGDNIGYADSLLANTDADFAVHTGDGVYDKYTDGVDSLFTKMLACTKPFFFCIGNHDCINAPSLAARYTQYIEPIVTKSAWYGSGMTLHHDTGKTYYSVDYTKGSAKYKCIFLDQGDGLDANPDNSTVCYGSYSDEQVVWFINQLQSAATNSQHVMVFVHVKPENLNQLQDWSDHLTSQWQANEGAGPTLMNIVAAFKNNQTYTYKGTDYSFSANGVFVGWFVGHTHSDDYGYCKTHPDQFVFVTTKPYEPGATQWDGNDGGPHINYITVDYYTRRVSLYRMGVQDTIMGTKRVAFYINY